MVEEETEREREKKEGGVKLWFYKQANLQLTLLPSYLICGDRQWDERRIGNTIPYNLPPSPPFPIPVNIRA